MDGLRASPSADFNHEKSMVKLKDVFTVFKDKKGNPHEEQVDDGVDFGDPEEEEPTKPTEPEVQGDAPEYEGYDRWTASRKGLKRRTKILGQATVSMGRNCGLRRHRCTLGWKARMGSRISTHSTEASSRQ